MLRHLSPESVHAINTGLIHRVVQDDDPGVRFDLRERFARQPAGFHVVTRHLAEHQVKLTHRRVHHDDRDVLSLGFEQAALDALPVYRIDENGGGLLLNQVGDVVLLFEAVELSVQRGEPVLVSFDAFQQAIVQVHEEGIVHGLKRDAKKPARTSGGAGGISLLAAASQQEDYQGKAEKLKS